MTGCKCQLKADGKGILFKPKLGGRITYFVTIFISILIGKVLKWAEQSFPDYKGMTAAGIERKPDIEKSIAIQN